MPLDARKLWLSLRGRQRAGPRWSQWALRDRLHDVRLWIHAPSVGEGLVVEPVMARLIRSIGAPVTTIRTFTSPSAEAWTSGYRYDQSDYLPSWPALEDMFRIIEPSVIVYPRADLWPALVHRAAEHGVPQVVVGGLVRPGSYRLRWPVRALTARMVKRITTIGVVAEAQRDIWQSIGADQSQIVVTGDPRDDQVLEHLTDLGWTNALREWAGEDFILVAGSTHRADEAHILRAAARAAVRTVVVPHDPSGDVIRRLVSGCTREGLRHKVITRPTPPPERDIRLLIVATTGQLQNIYPLGSAAFIGGGFDTGRVHSLLEPASIGIPMLCGPKADADPTARRFLHAGGARIVGDWTDIATACEEWRSEGPRNMAGLKARALLKPGAAAKTARLIVNVLQGKKPGSLPVLNDNSLERDRPRHDQAQGQACHQYVDEPAANVDLQVGNFASGDQLS